MKTKHLFGMLFVAFLAVAGLTACSEESNDVIPDKVETDGSKGGTDEENPDKGSFGEKLEEDKVEVVTMYVSAEIGSGYLDYDQVEPVECMLAKESGAEEWQHLYFTEIHGFEYEQGYNYELSVEKTTLADPPADASCYLYRLLEIISKEPAGD